MRLRFAADAERQNTATLCYNESCAKKGVMRPHRLVRHVLTLGRRLYTAAYERHYNIRTGFEKVRVVDERHSDSQPYEPTDYLLIQRFIGPLKLQPADVVFDIGCGMGRVLCVIARSKVKKCIGIELSAELASIAMQNTKRLRFRKAPIEIRVTDACSADYSEGTVFWMFNPFGASVMHLVLARIQQSVTRIPRTVRISYVNPVHENVFHRQTWLTCIGRKSFWGSKNVASYWVNK
jgi:SAM-dependent methyltransferase